MSQTSWFDDEEETKLLAEGVYTCILSNATLDETKPDARISVEFLHDNKRKSWLNLTFGETRKKFVNWQLRELGVYDRTKEISIAKNQSPARSALEAIGEILGAVCEIVIEHNEWQGKTYANVRVESCNGAIQSSMPKVGSPATRAAAPTLGQDAPPSFDSGEELPF